MEPHTRDLCLDDRINLLNQDAVDTSPALQIYRTVSAILVLVQEKMIDDEYSVQLSGYCYNVCEILKARIKGKNAEDLSDSVKIILENLERLIRDIERTLASGTDAPRVGYNKERLEKHRLEIQVILSNLDETFNVAESTTSTAFIGSGTAVIPATQSACLRLIERASAADKLPSDELTSLIKAVFSSPGEDDVIRVLDGDDAQKFIDVVDKALDSLKFSLQIRKKGLKRLYKTCGRIERVPESLRVPHCYDRMGDPLYRGGFGDVWKGEYRDRNVAVKAIRKFSQESLRKIIGRFCKEVVTWKFLHHPNVLPLIGVTMTEARFEMISEWMVNGNINEFVKKNPEADRLKLLRGVAEGLIYLHNEDMIHGDLKGANILVDESCHARLADFGLLTIMSDPENGSSSTFSGQGGTSRWMSPELVDPARFKLENSKPTKASDCYALGMVIYETISGHLPFHKVSLGMSVLLMVLNDERPPREACFTDTLWSMLEMCWKPEPADRPSIKDVLQCLVVELPSRSDAETEEGGNDVDSLDDSFCTPMNPQV